MTPKRFMVIAGEASGDVLAAELVRELRAAAARKWTYTGDQQPLDSDLAPKFFGAGGPRMAEAGVEILEDMTAHSVVGLVEVVKRLGSYRRIFLSLLEAAAEREPDAIICVDFAGFNRCFASAVKRMVWSRRGPFFRWNPKLIQFVSPQVWASREGRAQKMQQCFDLLLSIFPFEKAWYARKAPRLKVEFVGHPMLDRYGKQNAAGPGSGLNAEAPRLVILPGSRNAELERHLPVMLGALQRIQKAIPGATAIMVLPNGALAERAKYAKTSTGATGLEVRIGGLESALSGAALAIAKTGTVTMECAYFGVPTVTMYKTSWGTYEVAKRLVTISTMTMPNILAGQAVFPEFIQSDATDYAVAEAALDLLRNSARRDAVKAKLGEIVASLGGPGASRRAAQSIMQLISAPAK